MTDRSPELSSRTYLSSRLFPHCFLTSSFHFLYDWARSSIGQNRALHCERRTQKNSLDELDPGPPPRLDRRRGQGAAASELRKKERSSQPSQGVTQRTEQSGCRQRWDRRPWVKRHMVMIEIRISPRATDVISRRSGGTPRCARTMLAATVGTTTASCGIKRRTRGLMGDTLA